MDTGSGEHADFDVSVLGLGAMGTAIAGALVKVGERVAVWNRSPQKATPLAALGAEATSSAEAAVRASPLSILVMLDAAAARETLAAAPGALAGRTIINFSSGGTDEAAALRSLVEEAGGRYVGGGIMAYPRNIGHPAAYIRYSGDEAAFEAHRALLQKLSGRMHFVSDAENAAIGPAIAAQVFVGMGGFYEALAVANRLGLPPAQFARRLADITEFFVRDAIDDAVRRLEQGDFGGEQATVDVHVAGLEKLVGSLKAAGVPSLMLEGFVTYAKQAQATGLGGEDIAAIIKTLAPLPG